jgi:predicted methyltransferase
MGPIVGPDGAVVSYQPAPWGVSEQAMAARAALEARVPNASLTRYVFDQFAPPEASMDFALINLSYHDIYWVSERYQIPFTNPDDYVVALFKGMKPGGIVGVIDHTGLAGDTRETVDATHRIDPAVVRADFERAGFVLVAQSDLLANPEDDLSISVFDPSIRGKTDRFLMKFVKPM